MENNRAVLVSLIVLAVGSLEFVRGQGLEFAAVSAEDAFKSAQRAPVAPDPLDRLLAADEDLVRVQSLLGQYVVGTTINGPVLRRAPVEITVGADYEALLAAFPFLQRTVVNGQIKVRLGADSPAEYGRLRGEFMARLSRVILLEKLANAGKDLSKGHLTWARGLMIVSQPECVSMAGREPWPDYCR